MNLDSQVCALEYSKQLKELGVKRESLFYWEYYSDEAHCIIASKERFSAAVKGADFYSAFSVAELGEMLPNNSNFMSSVGLSFWLAKINSDASRWECDILVDGKSQVIYGDNNEANLRAKMLIWLIEQGHVKP